MTQEIHSALLENLTVPVDRGIELQLVSPELDVEMYALIKKNLDHLSSWISPEIAGAIEAFGEEDRITGHLLQLEAYNAGNAYPMALYVQDRLAGMVNIRNIGSEEGAEVDYWIDKEHTGKGIASRSVQSLIDFACERHQINKVVLNTYEDNEQSSKLAIRLGFVQEGIKENEEGIWEKHFVKIYEPRHAN